MNGKFSFVDVAEFGYHTIPILYSAHPQLIIFGIGIAITNTLLVSARGFDPRRIQEYSFYLILLYQLGNLYVFVVDYLHRDRFARNAVVVCGNGTVLKKSSTVLTSTPKADRTLSVMSESDAIQYMVAGGR